MAALPAVRATLLHALITAPSPKDNRRKAPPARWVGSSQRQSMVAVR
jgi:hypothetical protein